MIFAELQVRGQAVTIMNVGCGGISNGYFVWHIATLQFYGVYAHSHYKHTTLNTYCTTNKYSEMQTNCSPYLSSGLKSTMKGSDRRG